jgi:hypothetical protein
MSDEVDGGDRNPKQPESRSLVNSSSEPLQRRAVPPGHPDGMPEGLRHRVARFFTEGTLRIKQATELAQALVGWDQANRYDVRDESGELLFQAQELAHGTFSAISRNFNPFYENTTDCMTVDGSRFLRLVFPFTFFFRRCNVLAWDAKAVGTVQNRFHLLKLRTDLQNPFGATLLEVHGPVLKFLSFSDWVFEVRRGTQVVAHIRKHWGGFIREAFTDADKLSIVFEPGFSDPRLRCLVFAAALTIDATAFEGNRRKPGGMDIASNISGFLD